MTGITAFPMITRMDDLERNRDHARRAGNQPGGPARRAGNLVMMPTSIRKPTDRAAEGGRINDDMIVSARRATR